MAPENIVIVLGMNDWKSYDGYFYLSSLWGG